MRMKWRMSRLLRAIAGVLLLSGALMGIAVRPEDIEELLHVHNRVEVEQSIQDEENDKDDD
mgnify:CR=1 FL=1